MAVAGDSDIKLFPLGTNRRPLGRGHGRFVGKTSATGDTSGGDLKIRVNVGSAGGNRLFVISELAIAGPAAGAAVRVLMAGDFWGGGNYVFAGTLPAGHSSSVFNYEGPPKLWKRPVPKPSSLNLYLGRVETPNVNGAAWTLVVKGVYHEESALDRYNIIPVL